MLSFQGMSTTLHSEPSERDINHNDTLLVIDHDAGKLASIESGNAAIKTVLEECEWKSSSVDPGKEAWTFNPNPREFLRNRAKRNNTKLVKNRIDQAGRFGCHYVLINVEREQVGVRPLARDHVLHVIARAHAEDMATHDSLHHSSASQTMFDVVKQSGSCRIIGENVTVTKTDKVMLTQYFLPQKLIKIIC